MHALQAVGHWFELSEAISRVERVIQKYSHKTERACLQKQTRSFCFLMNFSHQRRDREDWVSLKRPNGYFILANANSKLAG